MIPTPETITTVVTGASTGIGRATALRQARAGDRVWALVRTPSACTDLAELAMVEGLDLRIAACDVSRDDSVDAAFAQILDDGGRVDRLVNNAGLFTSATLEAETIADIKDVFEVNYFGALRCVQKVLPGMREAGGGVVCAVTSNSSQAIFPSWTAYAGSKCALEGSLESVAHEVAAFGIRIAIVQPGITLTAMRGKISARSNPPAYEAILRRYRTIIAADRRESMDPDDVAIAIGRVLTDPASPFRTRVGADAVRNIALRERIGDEDWVTLFAPIEDDDFYARWSDLAGVPDARTIADRQLLDPSSA